MVARFMLPVPVSFAASTVARYPRPRFGCFRRSLGFQL
jgi:hypothetical protein